MTNEPSKYESYRTNDLRGDAFTKWSRTGIRTNRRTHRQKKGQTEKWYAPILSYARHKNGVYQSEMCCSGLKEQHNDDRRYSLHSMDGTCKGQHINYVIEF